VRFNVMLVDPPGYKFGIFLHDTARYLVHGLEALGHDVILGRTRFEPSRTNILLNAHSLSRPDDVQAILSTGAPIIVYNTEVIRRERINLTEEQRYREVYRPLLEGASLVWDWSDDNVALLRAQGIRAEWLRLGYHPAMEEIRHKRDKDLDFLFYGSITPHRADVLNALAKRGFKVHAEFDCPAVYRNDLIARSRVVLTLRQSAEMDHLPYFRINYLVNNRALVAGERGIDGQWMEDAFLGCPDGVDLVDFLSDVIARPDLPAVAERHHRSLMERPMSAFLAASLRDRLDLQKRGDSEPLRSETA
jgi:hypothetical protein